MSYVRGVASIGLNEHILDMLGVHQRRELDGSVEVPLRASTWSTPTHPRLKRLGCRSQAYDEDVRARYGLPIAVELGARLEDSRDEQPARAGPLVVLPQRGQIH